MERHFGHHLRKTVEEALTLTRQKPLKPSIAKELDALSHFYSQHLFRYGGFQDIFPNDLPYEGVLERAVAGVRLIKIEMAKAGKRGDLLS